VGPLHDPLPAMPMRAGSGLATLLQPPFSPATTTNTSENRRRTRKEDATLRLCEPARRAALGADRFRGRSCEAYGIMCNTRANHHHELLEQWTGCGPCMGWVGSVVWRVSGAPRVGDNLTQPAEGAVLWSGCEARARVGHLWIFADQTPCACGGSGGECTCSIHQPPPRGSVE
jgi:hypothetical protein